MTTFKKDVTVFIGRVSPFHNGHAHVLERALKSSRLTIVLVGSSGQARNVKNPFTYDERKGMIEAFVNTVEGPKGAVRIMPLFDLASDNAWIESVQNSVSTAIGLHQKVAMSFGKAVLLTDIYLTGSDRDQTTWYLKSFPQWKKDLVSPFANSDDRSVSATSVRQILYESGLTDIELAALNKKVPASTVQFLRNFVQGPHLKALRDEFSFIKKYKAAWASAPYEPTFNCADAVVIQSGHILVVKRGAQPGKGLWALPGGFIGGNERSADAAVRELMEETGILLTTGKRAAEITESMLKSSIKAKELFDAPDRSARGRTFSTAYLFRLDDTKPLPVVKGQLVPTYESGGVDTVETEDAFWLPISQALSRSNMWFEDHLEIARWGINVYDSF